MMTQLLALRDRLKAFYSRYENFCRPGLKFVLALVTLTMINKGIGYSGALKNFAVVLVISLLCSFFPMNFIVVVGAMVTLLHLYATSLECVIAVGVLFLVMFLLYFRFSSKDTILLLMTPLCFVLKIPYVAPICAGLIAAPTAVVSTGCGVVTYYMLSFIAVNRSTLLSMSEESILEKLRFLLGGLAGNREMEVMVAAFAITILIVYLIRRLPVDHAWTIAIISGLLVDILVILIGDLKYNTYISVAGLIFGSVAAFAAAWVLQFFVFNVDYSRTEKVQFEDDEYYYYVKAVPKNVVPPTERSVKKIKGQEKDDVLHRRKRSDRERASERDAQEYRMRRSATREDEDSDSSVARNKNRTKRIVMAEDARARRSAPKSDRKEET